LAIVLGLIVVVYFAATFDITKASEESQKEDKTINLTNIPTPDEKAADKKFIEHNSRRVGLMIGKNAHKELCPEVGDWLKRDRNDMLELVH